MQQPMFPIFFKTIGLTLALIGSSSFSWADGFSYLRARERNAHIVLQLSPDQVETVGRERKLVLTETQKKTLAKFTKRPPSVLGVESLGEPDCSCHISSALWTATSEVPFGSSDSLETLMAASIIAKFVNTLVTSQPMLPAKSSRRVSPSVGLNSRRQSSP